MVSAILHRSEYQSVITRQNSAAYQKLDLYIIEHNKNGKNGIVMEKDYLSLHWKTMKNWLMLKRENIRK